MVDIDVKSTTWKEVEVGRVVIFLDGPFKGRLAAIVEIIDHKRVCILILVWRMPTLVN